MGLTRRNFIKGALAWLGAAFLPACDIVEVKADEEDGIEELVQTDEINDARYRLVFEQTYFTEHMPDGDDYENLEFKSLGFWEHKHNGIPILKVRCGSFLDNVPSLAWWWGCQPDWESDSFRSAVEYVQGHLERIDWTGHLKSVSFSVPRWIMDDLCTLPENNDDKSL
jgi:hypothetical protein